ncbi:Signal transducer regulating beta-lactamase production, contains metallopeptidase domain [Flavobacterium swingsii]|uniref:Signal transducer regulating beta-lactamase production, contains metallopeptidase domain n=1 Tax=Flavobacterium swingsii TaxID=498292 RepID=A0A1I0UZT6_9FLAO|nr:M56 family metallopeptidase [Flavobacterium swingsii]SFA69287.1 Signal transducer regulating beta-lactamase production, contains metallopeptidase domain [Flavobacterium swingsii]
MEAIFIYLLKANLLIDIFYLAYYFLVQKETFFNSNRWFLLSGLFTSVLIPLFFIKKIVIIEAPKLIATNLPSIKNTNINTVIDKSIDWYNILLVIYILISIILILKITSELVSFFSLIKNKKITVNKPFAMVDIDENINPFSFFKYIVFNSTKYSNSELENILNHEKVHSKEKHSLDVLIAKVFCTLFWFNPFVWLYKKAIIQNLEYIADQKAIKNIEDKKAYQMTLLKVVTDHNCLSITNSFYQSLIKKRIVMLNKNQSKQKNVWKYALVIPALIAFVIFFQVKVIAQEKITHHKDRSSGTKQVSEMTWTKDTPDDEIKTDVQSMKKIGVEVNYSDLKRNSQGEITAIKIAFKDKSGKTGSLLYSGDTPIKPIVLRKEIDANDNTKVSLGELAELDNLNQELSIPEPPTPPTPPTPPITKMVNMPKPPTPPTFPTPPNVKAPNDPNDKKAWRKFEEKMEKFEQAWNTEEIKEYENNMKAYEKEMEAYEPDMTAFEKEMEKFESKMEKFEEEMEAYQERIHKSHKD